MSIGGTNNELKKSNQFTASIKPKLKHLNTLAYEDFYDLEKKREGGSDQKKMR